MAEASERYRWKFTYSVGGDVRFLSHHDTLRLFRRALARAGLPVRHSEGFNPHPRISIPLPRPVGLASEAEVLIVEFEERIDATDAFGRLGEQMPTGVRLTEARPLLIGETVQPDWARYHLSVDLLEAPDLRNKARDLLDAEIVNVKRFNHKQQRTRVINLRPYLMDLNIQDDGVLFTLRVCGDGSAKPSEIAGLLGYDAGSINHRIRRTEVRWK